MSLRKKSPSLGGAKLKKECIYEPSNLLDLVTYQGFKLRKILV